MDEACPSCCAACVTSPPSPSSAGSSGAYSLSNFFPAGAIILGASCGKLVCHHTHSEDGWHSFGGVDLLAQDATTIEDDLFLCEMDFLIRNRFISATCRTGPLRKMLYVRIYIIPFDLSGVQGKLRAREPDILVAATRYMATVLGRVIQEPRAWRGDDLEMPVELAKPLLSQEVDTRSMTKIYSDLPSPDIAGLYMRASESPAWDYIRPVLAKEQIEGLRSQLYPYQFESVAAMLEKELCAFRVPDPLFIPLKGMDGQIFHLQPARMEILRERPIVSGPRGGILCEELGTGKTVMVLALILSTIDQLSQPEESILDPRPVMTPLSFRNFPFAEHAAARRRIHNGKRRDSKNVNKEKTHVPSLVELLLNFIRVSPQKVGVRGHEQSLEERHFWALQASNPPFYYHFDVEIIEQVRAQRRTSTPGPRRIYLTCATLIVVPINLLAQWDTEIQKHCDTWLRVLVVRPTTEIPRAQTLASDYDIVLLSHNILSSAKSDISKLHSWAVCNCPTLSGTRIPDCHCDDQTNVSPLLQVRWKRLIVDEGHVSSAISTNLSQFANILSAERRWIVTGTPTTNLLGLSFGSGDDSYIQSSDDLDDLRDEDTIETSSVQMDQDDELESRVFLPRVWTTSDREDLHKLGNMISHFLNMRHFAEPGVFQKHVIAPLLDLQGPRPGAVQLLTQVMEMAMIRHRIEDVEKDVVLPPLKQETILLDLGAYALKSYNAAQATIVINAIDSERKDQDYLFHPRNAADLSRTVENMTQLMFWHTDPNVYNVDELVKASPETLERAISRGASEEDLSLLRQAIFHMRVAAKDKMWRYMQAHPDVQYRVDDIPSDIYRAWTRLAPSLPEMPSQSSYITDGFLQPDRLVRLREMVLAVPFASERRIMEWGHLVSEEDQQKQMFHLFHERAKKKHRGNKNDADFKTIDLAKKEEAPEKMKEILRELAAAHERLNRAREGVDVSEHGCVVTDKLPGVSESTVRDSTLGASPIAKVRICGSTSSKLSYILNEILQHGSTEKFLIFSKMPLSLAFIAEGLEVIQVKYLQFTSNVATRVREQLVTTFETSDKYRVFLMELKHGARGLNLTTASRIIFCEPVWQADVESQAIKRAHRIGQTRAITVKTLAIRLTSEEVMVARREALKRRSDKVPSFVEETNMRHFIAHPKFLSESVSDHIGLDISLLPTPRAVPTLSEEEVLVSSGNSPGNGVSSSMLSIGSERSVGDDSDRLPLRNGRGPPFHGDGTLPFVRDTGLFEAIETELEKPPPKRRRMIRFANE